MRWNMLWETHVALRDQLGGIAEHSITRGETMPFNDSAQLIDRQRPHIDLLLLILEAPGVLLSADHGCIAVQLVVPCCFCGAF